MKVAASFVLILAVASACIPGAAGVQALTNDVADLLQEPPQAGESVEIEAYFSGAAAVPMLGFPRPPDDEVWCPTYALYTTALTDRPLLPTLYVLNSTHSNAPSEYEPWLAATLPEQTQSGSYTGPQLPYHARFRGYLNDAAFAHCPHPDRIFVVEEVVEVYEEKPPERVFGWPEVPKDYAGWPRYADGIYGYTIPYPADWTVEAASEPDTPSAVYLRGPEWPDYPVSVRVYDGEFHYDQYDPGSGSRFFDAAEGYGIFQQGGSLGGGSFESQGLDGYETMSQDDATGEVMQAALFSGGGYTYQISLRYPTGFDASQTLLTTFTMMVVGFRLDTLPGPTATPPVRQSLGPGPFLTQEEIAARLLDDSGQTPTILEAQLIPEVEARDRADACETFFGHPEGVWLVKIQGTYEGTTRTMILFLDAVTGEQLCGEEVSPP